MARCGGAKKFRATDEAFDEQVLEAARRLSNPLIASAGSGAPDRNFSIAFAVLACRRAFRACDRQRSRSWPSQSNRGPRRSLCLTGAALPVSDGRALAYGANQLADKCSGATDQCQAVHRPPHPGRQSARPPRRSWIPQRQIGHPGHNADQASQARRLRPSNRSWPVPQHAREQEEDSRQHDDCVQVARHGRRNDQLGHEDSQGDACGDADRDDPQQQLAPVAPRIFPAQVRPCCQRAAAAPSSRSSTVAGVMGRSSKRASNSAPYRSRQTGG